MSTFLPLLFSSTLLSFYISSHLDAITLEKLSQKSPNLQTLSINGCPVPVESKSMEFGFRNLQNMVIGVSPKSLSLVPSYLHILAQTTFLRSFHLHCPGSGFILCSNGHVDNSVLKGLTEATSAFRSLQELAISISSAYAKVVNPDSAHLDPLIHLTRLESVSFKGVDFDLTDAIIQRLISAWGNLKKFYVHSRSRSSEGAPPVSLAVLRLFAAYTPKLEDLRINLDATCVPSCDSQDSVRASVLPVHMDFNCSPIQMLDNPRQVIEYIASIHPHAIIHSTPKYCCAPQGCKYHDTWKQVGETIASMATLSENSIPKFQN